MLGATHRAPSRIPRTLLGVLLVGLLVYLLTAAPPELGRAETRTPAVTLSPLAAAPARASSAVAPAASSACAAAGAANASPLPPPPAWQRASVAPPHSSGQSSSGSGLSAALRRARDFGFSPKYILDVGANSGDFSREAWSVFGAASPPPRVLMFEGAAARAPTLAGVGFDFVISVMGACTRLVDWYASDTAHTGNSVLRENTAHFKAVAPATEVMRTVDDLLATAPALAASGGALDGPALLKLDVQGSELEVIKGAAAALAATEMLLLEVSVLPYNKGSPLVTEVLAAVGALGFDVLDLTEVHGAGPAAQLIQLDFSFVRRDSDLFRRAIKAADIVT